MCTVYSEAFSKNGKIKHQAQCYVEALKSRVYNTLFKYSYAPFVRLMGGNYKLFQLIKLTIEDLASKGISIDTFSIGDPQKYKSQVDNYIA